MLGIFLFICLHGFIASFSIPTRMEVSGIRGIGVCCCSTSFDRVFRSLLDEKLVGEVSYIIPRSLV